MTSEQLKQGKSLQTLITMIEFALDEKCKVHDKFLTAYEFMDEKERKELINSINNVLSNKLEAHHAEFANL